MREGSPWDGLHIGRARTDTEQPRGVEHAVSELLVEALWGLRRAARGHALFWLSQGAEGVYIQGVRWEIHAPWQISSLDRVGLLQRRGASRCSSVEARLLRASRAGPARPVRPGVHLS